jgi:site-specific DNA-methyltransferase (adenine-specific)
MKAMPKDSVDSIVTDPPYGWRFMGKAWDRFDIDKKAEQGKRPGETYVGKDGVTRKTRDLTAEAAGKYDVSCEGNRAFQVFTEEWAREAFRVLKPGGHMLVFCGPRTYHRMASGVEDAGFEIRDQLQWLFGSGFPKSLDVSKAMDKAAGAEREVVGNNPSALPNHGDNPNLVALNQLSGDCVLTAPATDLARTWSGWGTALKPANEPIVLARKPLIGTVAKNVETYGTGALNIDASRIEAGGEKINYGATKDKAPDPNCYGKYNLRSGDGAHAQGRWPANVILSEDAAEALDEQVKGKQHAAGNKKPAKMNKSIWESGKNFEKEINFRDFDGGASRFFYVAKSSKRERNAGLEGMPQALGGSLEGGNDKRKGDKPQLSMRANHHPTVKPIALMEYLVRMVTPPGGTVLDPFAGSGTTGCACAKLGFQFIGIEREPEYAAIAEKRIAHWSEAE